MSLRKFSIPFSDPLLRDIYLRLMDNADILDIETLSYLSTALRDRFHTEIHRPQYRLGMVKTMPRLLYHLENIQTKEELRQIVICFYNQALLISDKMMDLLVEKVNIFIDNGELGCFFHIDFATIHDWLERCSQGTSINRF